MNSKIKTGQYFTAINECKMSDGRNALIIGKKYPIVESNPVRIVVHTEVSEEHIFKVKDLNRFFLIS